MKAPGEMKQAAVVQWTEEPAGAVLADAYPRGSREFFEEVERTRYELYPWLRRDYLRRSGWRGKRVLEVGVGLGTDHLQLLRSGADVVGIDLTPKSIEYTTRRFELIGQSAELTVADAEQLPFEGGTFDAVYSFGVLHHTPNFHRAVDEIRRVLKPGGHALVGVYNRHSYFYAQRLIRYAASASWRRKGIAEMRADFEFGQGQPLVSLFSRTELLRAFGDYSEITVEARHLPTNRLPVVLRSGADRALRGLERRVGWYWMVEATKA